jgi:hypothetical protein
LHDLPAPADAIKAPLAHNERGRWSGADHPLDDWAYQRAAAAVLKRQQE